MKTEIQLEGLDRTALDWYSYPSGYEKKQRMIDEMTESCRDHFWEACARVRARGLVETVKNQDGHFESQLTKLGRQVMGEHEQLMREQLNGKQT